MDLNLCLKNRMTQQKEIIKNLTKYNWQMMLTGTAKPDTGFSRLDSIFAKWRSRAAKATGCQIGTVGVFVAQPQPHVHVLLIGSNRNGKTLLDVHPDIIQGLQESWRSMTHRSCEVSQINDHGAVRYIVEHNMQGMSWRSLTPHNIRLLNRAIKP